MQWIFLPLQYLGPDFGLGPDPEIPKSVGTLLWTRSSLGWSYASLIPKANSLMVSAEGAKTGPECKVLNRALWALHKS